METHSLFLRVIKPEIELPADIDPYSEEVYRKGSQIYYGSKTMVF